MLEFHYSTSLTLNQIVEKTEQFTFPSIKKKLQLRHIKEPFTGVWAVRNKKMLGMILAGYNQAGIPEIFSFFVSPSERNQKIGDQLLTSLEQLLKEKGATVVQSQYRTDWGSLEVIEKMLNSHKWEKPQVLKLIAKENITRVPYVPWPKIKIEKGVSVFNWSKLSADDRKNLIQLISKKTDLQEFNPFHAEDKIYKPTSFGLRKDEKVIGWNIAYAYSEDTLEYNNLYVMENSRNFGYAITLMRYSGETQYELKIPYATWFINVNNSPILKILRYLEADNPVKYIEVRSSAKLFIR